MSNPMNVLCFEVACSVVQHSESKKIRCECTTLRENQGESQRGICTCTRDWPSKGSLIGVHVGESIAHRESYICELTEQVRNS